MHGCQLKSNFHKTCQEYVATHNGVIIHPKFQGGKKTKPSEFFTLFPKILITVMQKKCLPVMKIYQ